MWEILLPFLGFFIGVLAAMTGVGGGIFMVPLLTLAYFFAPANAVGTSLATIILTALAATLNYSRQKRIYYKIGLTMAVATAPGAVLGAYMTSIVSARILGLVFGAFLILVALQIIAKNEISKKRYKNTKEDNLSRNSLEEDFFRHKGRAAVGMILVFLGGVTSGLFGVGGGVILVPIMIIAFQIPIHFAIATSMFCMIFTSLSGVGQHFLFGNINFGFALLLGAGSIIGAQIGAQVCKRISGKKLNAIFAILLMAIAIQMIVKFF